MSKRIFFSFIAMSAIIFSAFTLLPASVNAGNPAEITAEKYNIINRKTGMYLNVFSNHGQAINGTRVNMLRPDYSNYQLFEIKLLGEYRYMLRSCAVRNTNYCVDAASDSDDLKSGVNLQIWENADFSGDRYTQQWYFESLGNGYYLIHPVLDKNLVLSVADMDHQNAVVLQTYQKGNELQWWRLRKA